MNIFSKDNVTDDKGITDNLVSCINRKYVHGKHFEYLKFRYIHTKTILVTAKWGVYTFSTIVDNHDTVSDVLVRFELKANFKNEDEYNNKKRQANTLR